MKHMHGFLLSKSLLTATVVALVGACLRYRQLPRPRCALADRWLGRGISR